MGGLGLLTEIHFFMGEAGKKADEESAQQYSENRDGDDGCVGVSGIHTGIWHTRC